MKSPGIVAAVRRHVVFDRTTDGSDEGGPQSGEQACAPLGQMYHTPLIGKALRQKHGAGTVIASGLGDRGAMRLQDLDVCLSPRKRIVAGVLSRGNTWQESDVARADGGCCQVVSP